MGHPRYGGTLRVEIREVVRTMDPGDWPADTAAAAAKDKLVSLIFDTLVRLDEDGLPQPGLALSWQHDTANQQWQFRLRPDVTFDDGSTMTAESVAAALQPGRSGWHLSAEGGVLSINSDLPAPDLLYELASTSRSVCLRGDNGGISGTGPFRIARWEPGRRALLTANVRYWAGRPFLDSVAIEMGRPLREQLLDLELNKADFVEVWPHEVRRLVQKGTRIWTTSPDILIALAFERGRPSAEDPRIREAISLSVDRTALHSVLMQKQGEPAAALLPQQLSGYAFLFSAGTDIQKARQLVSGLGQALPPLALAYDTADPLARAVAERIALNAREAGLTLQVSGRAAGADMRLVRLPIRSALPAQALAQLISTFHLADLWQPAQNESIEALYATERAIVDSHRLIPLIHLPETFGTSATLRSWATQGVCRSGRWRFDDMWLDVEKP